MIKARDVTLITKTTAPPLAPSIAARGYVTDRETCLYRHFSKSGELLYVGASVSPIARNEEHRSIAHWFRQIARVELEWFPSYAAAIIAERRAIQSENPRHNKVRYDGNAPLETPRPIGRPRKPHALTNAERQKAYRDRKKCEPG